MHAASGLYFWSMELSTLGSLLLAPKLFDRLCSVSFFLVSERGGRSRPLRETPCRSLDVAGHRLILLPRQGGEQAVSSYCCCSAAMICYVNSSRIPGSTYTSARIPTAVCMICRAM